MMGCMCAMLLSDIVADHRRLPAPCLPLSKAGKIVSHDVDDDLDLDVQVVVCDDVAHTLHIGPVDIRHGPERVGSDSLRLLPNLFEALRDGIHAMLSSDQLSPVRSTYALIASAHSMIRSRASLSRGVIEHHPIAADPVRE